MNFTADELEYYHWSKALETHQEDLNFFMLSSENSRTEVSTGDLMDVDEMNESDLSIQAMNQNLISKSGDNSYPFIQKTTMYQSSQSNPLNLSHLDGMARVQSDNASSNSDSDEVTIFSKRRSSAFIIDDSDEDMYDGNVSVESITTRVNISPSPSRTSDYDENETSLSFLGQKNLVKLRATGQYLHGPKPKNCQTCDEPMDWRTTGTLKPRNDKYGELYYSYGNAHNFNCVKVAYSNKAKQKANDARAAGMCPGAFNNGCRDKNQSVDGRIFCSECQEKMNAHNRTLVQIQRVITSKERKVERDKGISILKPIALSLATVSFKEYISKGVLKLLEKPNQIIWADCEVTDNSKTGESAYMWSFLDTQQDVLMFMFRNGAPGGWHWNITYSLSDTPIRCDKTETKRRIQEFIGTKTIAYYASNNGHDELIFNDWWGSNFFKWLNMGKDVWFKITGHKGVIQTTTMSHETLHDNLYLANGINHRKPATFIELEPNPHESYPVKNRNDVRKMYNLAMAIHYNLC